MEKVRDGDLYKLIKVYDREFDLRYGYYEEFERDIGEPIPIYPDFLKEPIYTADGRPFVTAMQDVCGEYSGSGNDNVCFSCEHYEAGEELIGICKCPRKKLA